MCDDVDGPNYVATQADARRRRGQVLPWQRSPPKSASTRLPSMPTTEAAIDHGLMRDLYLVIGDPQDDGGWAVRSYIKPFANWIWIGCHPDVARRASSA